MSQLCGVEPNYLARHKSPCIGESGPSSEQPNVPGESAGVMLGDLPLGRASTVENSDGAFHNDDAIKWVIPGSKYHRSRWHLLDASTRACSIEFVGVQARKSRIGF
jgi:hypothetical protein